jgi:hypothetical protein
MTSIHLRNPTVQVAIDRLPMSDRAPRLRFRMGDGYLAGAAGDDEHIGDVLHMYVE